MDKNTYKLLTPGPLTTTATVKEAMQIDRCTWDEDYKSMTQGIRSGLLKLAHADNGAYTTVLMQGSGTFGVESVLSSVISSMDKVLVLQNGAYSKRMVEMCDYHGIKYVVYEEDYAHIPDPMIVEDVLKSDGNITHIAMVHSETTSGLLNDIASIGALAQKYNKKFIVDAMSSFGGVDINVPQLGITYLVSSANKCIQGVPGFSFIIANVEDLRKPKVLPAACRWIYTPSGKPWKTTAANGALPRRRMLWLRLHRPCRSWKRKAALPQGMHAIPRPTAPCAKAWKNLALRPISTKRIRGRLLPPSFTRRTANLPLRKCMPT